MWAHDAVAEYAADRFGVRRSRYIWGLRVGQRPRMPRRFFEAAPVTCAA